MGSLTRLFPPKWRSVGLTVAGTAILTVLLSLPHTFHSHLFELRRLEQEEKATPTTIYNKSDMIIRATGMYSEANSTESPEKLDELYVKPSDHELGCRHYELPPSGEEDMVSWLRSVFPSGFTGTFIEMGANNGLNSNTVGLERSGWTGVCIEPAPENFKMLSKNRPRCKNVQALISDEPGTATFREFGGELCGHSGLLSSRSQRAWMKLLSDHPESKYLDHALPVRTLPDVLKEHHLSSEIDLFILDVEGEELKVLTSLNLNIVVVHVWVVESNKISRDALDEFMGRWGYLCMHKQINSYCKRQNESGKPGGGEYVTTKTF